ncbi:T4SS efffector SepA family protein [Pseudovibrio exalbescens]|uniref:T4SS efffector SepA family protein n=1 Tax=Pseudovibrio exalbescens TaxID=197461 RepID=UPI000C9B4CF1|nr:hypothetical protein [Pseudovibrio exalbescens]
MPVVRINDATFADLKSIATWFGTKTPGETIDRIVREAMERLGMERDDEPEMATTTTDGEAMQFDTAPGLTYTKPRTASINGKAIHGRPWSEILLTMIGELRAKGFEGEKLVRELGIPAKTEQYDDEGFKYRPDLGISVQGQSASDCWKEIDRIAKKWRIPVSVEFRWKQDAKAQYPGKTGVLRSGNA